MTILDTFVLLFKSDAGATRKDVKALEDQIESLTAKGRKRSEAENKALIQSKKQLKEITQEIKDQGKAVDELNGSFVKLIEGAVGALTAYASFSALKSGLVDANRLNSALYLNQKITGQNAGEMKAYGAAIEAAGGSQEAFFGTINKWTEQVASAGQPLEKIGILLRRIRADIAKQPLQEQRRLLTDRYGITDPGFISLLEQSNEEFERNVALIEKHADATNKAAPAARAFQEQWANTKNTFQDVFSLIGSDIDPSLTDMSKKLEGIGEFFTRHQGVAETFFTVLSVGSIAASAKILDVSAAFFGLSTNIALVTRNLGLLIFQAAAAWEIGKGVRDVLHPDEDRQSFLGKGADWLADKIVTGSEKIMGTYRAPRASNSAPMAPDEMSDNQKESYAFWLEMGYPPAAAAGLVANEKHESGFNPKAVGDNGQAIGAFQWHADRRKRIKDAIGIDIENANHREQLLGANWELAKSGLSLDLKQMTDPAAAAALVSRQFERPANGDYEAMARGRTASGIDAANSIRAASGLSAAGLGATSAAGSALQSTKSISVKIDDVHVNTQATDAGGIARGVSEALQREMATALASVDDGVQK